MRVKKQTNFFTPISNSLLIESDLTNSELGFFIRLLALANRIPSRVEASNGKTVFNLNRGDVGYSIEELSEKMHVDRKTVARMLTTLAELKYIEVDSKAYSGTVIKVLNFDSLVIDNIELKHNSSRGKKGYDKGYDKGQDEGYDTGPDKGQDEGYDTGHTLKGKRVNDKMGKREDAEIATNNNQPLSDKTSSSNKEDQELKDLLDNLSF